MPTKNGNITANIIIKWVTVILSVASGILVIAFYIAGMERVTAEQAKDIQYGAVRDDDHEVRIRKLEEYVAESREQTREIREQRSILDRILDVVERGGQ